MILKVLNSFWAGFSPRFNRYLIIRDETMKIQNLFIYAIHIIVSLDYYPTFSPVSLCLFIELFFTLYVNPCSRKFSYVWGTGFLTYSRYKPKYAPNYSLDIYIKMLYWMILHVSILTGPPSRNEISEIHHKTKLDTFLHNWRGVKETGA